MKFTLSWLKQHLDTDAPLGALCDKLTAIGLEVESVKDKSKDLAPFIIAQILKADPHPQADRLRVCVVDTGRDHLQVVCGAPNARAGLKAVLARPGDRMPDSGEVLKKGVIRGVESQGMLCALDELGLGSDHEGIIELPADAPLGASYMHYAQLDDAVVEINLTPNRPDCAGVHGIARDLAAAGMGKLKPLAFTSHPATEPCSIKVILDLPNIPKACPLFVGRLIRNIDNRPSPAWLQQRLEAIGLRPVSALVDITNYLTFDVARPLHVFDAQKIQGPLRVFTAKGGETFTALNGKTYTLEAGMTVIGDTSGILSLAGVMGGSSTACDASTRDVFIESALFDPVITSKTGRQLQITSDARYRFERGVDPEFTTLGADYATSMILDLCGTHETSVSVIETVGSPPQHAFPIALETHQCIQRLGLDVPRDEQEKILSDLGFSIKREGETTLHVTRPSWRPDIEGPADLIEEIIRIKGLDHIHATALPRLSSLTTSAIDIMDARAGSARRALAAQGLLETITWSFMPSGLAEKFGPLDQNLRLLNPISSDLDILRPSVLGNLLMAAQRNADRGYADVGLFEIGPIFKNATPDGQISLATVLRAGATPRHWKTPSRPVDAYDAKADALAALTACGAPVASLQMTTDAPASYHPGRSGALRLGPTLLALFGELHPALLQAYGIKGPVVGCEIFFGSIPQSRTTSTARTLLVLDALQSVARDFAFVVDRSVTAAKLIKAVKDADKNSIRDVTVFDVYEGEHVAHDKKSVALSVTLQPTDKTLTDADIELISARITASVTKATGAMLRG